MRDTIKEFLSCMKKAFSISVLLLLICGLAYPLAITGIAKTLFPYRANGSIIEIGGKKIGSELIGQEFSSEFFMRGRPSAVNYNTYTKEQAEKGGYAGVSSGSNNFAPSNPKLTERVKADMAAFLAANPELKAKDIPTDMLTASGSGLDPHISPQSANIQLARISKASGISSDKLSAFVAAHTRGRAFGIFGEESVNVLGVNIEIAKEMGLIRPE
ncbi:MAG: potassium-transporting ATPase subunit KdpC [Synergistaceae bacterium]